MTKARPTQDINTSDNSTSGSDLQAANTNRSNKQSKNKPVLKMGLLIFGLILIALVEYLVISQFVCPSQPSESKPQPAAETAETAAAAPQGMMIMIEYKDTVGLVNFVNELYQRQIPSALLASPEFVQENCEEIKKLTDYGVEIIGSNAEMQFWDMPYEEQHQRISEIKSGIEACTGKPLKIVGSRFFASDENTVKAAEELGIPYVTARGTTGTKATIYDPTDYDVKLLSVSNIEEVEFKYGSLCDYSFWTREGSPADMRRNLLDAFDRYDKVTPVSHTNIGGYLTDWLSMWQNFWDKNEVEWLSLDEMMAETDYEMPFYEIPQNRNFPYTPEMLEHVETDEQVMENTVSNPCAIDDLPAAGNPEDNPTAAPSPASDAQPEAQEQVVMFHNNQGAMCLEALDFFANEGIEIQEVLTSDPNFRSGLESYKADFTESEGVSDSFGYYPIIFTQNSAYSGFNDEVKLKLQQELEQR